MTLQNAWAVIPAAGSGERFSPTENKLLAPLGGLPVIIRTLQAVLAAQRIDGVVLSTTASQISSIHQLLDSHELTKPVLVVPGGKSRRESVFLGLQEVPPGVKLIAIHDAARPLLNTDKLDACIEELQYADKDDDLSGIILALPVFDTLKQAAKVEDTPKITQTLDRSLLWRAQTPQVFWRDPLTQAHRSVHPELTITDDAQLVEIAEAGAVRLLTGEARNIKITTREDLILAEALLRAF